MNMTPAPLEAQSDATPRPVATFLELVGIDSPSGQETRVAEHLLTRLQAVGVAARRDTAGNVIGRRPGSGALAAEAPFLLSAHMDTVQPGIGIRPQIVGGVIRTDGSTILGADDKAGITAILESLTRVQERGADCRPVELVLTVEEETGLTGSKGLDLASIEARYGVVLDSNGSVGTIVNQAPAQNSLEVTVTGKAAHAGVSPELGISAIQVAARAIAQMRLGRIDPETTANIGVINGGVATNIIPERVTLKGETRSRSEVKLEAQAAHMVACFKEAAAEAGAQVEVKVTRSYGAINVAPESGLIGLLAGALRRCGHEPRLVPTGGGSDANIYNAAGIEAVNLGVGYENMHSVDERIAIADLLAICDVLYSVLTDR